MAGEVSNTNVSQKPRREKSYAAVDLKPRCPYYPNVDSDLYCAYFMMCNTQPAYSGAPSPHTYQNGYRNGYRNGTIPYMALSLGLIAVVISWMSFIPFIGVLFLIVTLIFAVLAIVLGGIGMKSIQYGHRGRGSATAGFTLGIVAMSVAIVLWVISAIIFEPYYYYYCCGI